MQAYGSEHGQVKWPQEMVLRARDSIKMTGGAVLIDAHQPVPAYLIPGILDQVKNKLLGFILSLRENDVTAEDLDNRTVKSEAARNLFYINI